MNDGGARNARSAVITLRVSSDASIGYKGCKGAARGVVLDYLTASIAQKAAYYKFFTPAKHLIA